MEQDTLEVVNYLRNRFKREKIFVLGHSWGSVLGLWLAHEHPGLVYAYVGVGQVINTEQNEEVGYRDTLRQARNSHNEQAVKSLESIAPYPPPNLDFGKMSILRDWERDLLGRPRARRCLPISRKFCHQLCQPLNILLWTTTAGSIALSSPSVYCCPKS